MKHAILLLFIFLNASLMAQDVIEYNGEKINALDEQGRKTGIWKVYVESKNLVIVTEFEEDNVVAGPMYYKNSELFAAIKDGKVELYENGETTEAHFQAEPLTMPVLVDNEGNELDTELYKYLFGPVPPMYYGGTNVLFDFIGKNIDQKAIKGKKGKVIVKFVIDKVGRTSEIDIQESTNPELNEESKRIIGILPRWQPAHQNGAFVRMMFMIPITIN